MYSAGTAHRKLGFDVVGVMQTNADSGQRAVWPPPCLEDWVPSPMTGVNRQMPDRVGGEEILVLEGMCRDEHAAAGRSAEQALVENRTLADRAS
jgi:hypothetical protein